MRACKDRGDVDPGSPSHFVNPKPRTHSYERLPTKPKPHQSEANTRRPNRTAMAYGIRGQLHFEKFVKP